MEEQVSPVVRPLFATANPIAGVPSVDEGGRSPISVAVGAPNSRMVPTESTLPSADAMAASTLSGAAPHRVAVVGCTQPVASLAVGFSTEWPASAPTVVPPPQVFV